MQESSDMKGLTMESLPSLCRHRRQGLIFVIDSNDRERIGEAREELNRMLNEDELRDAVLLIFANKQDLPNAMNAAEITGSFFSNTGTHAHKLEHKHLQ